MAMDQNTGSGDSIQVLRHAGPYLMAIVLSAWGGIVASLTRNRRRKFSLRELLLDVVISSFVGILTHLLCRWANLDGYMSAILIAVSGHMGTRALAGFESLRDRVLGVR